MAALTVSKVIRQVRQRIGLSQEALARQLYATSSSVQQWERGRNKPRLPRLVILRDLCPPGPDRKRLEAVIKDLEGQIAPSRFGDAGKTTRRRYALYPGTVENMLKLRKEKHKLQQRVQRLQKLVESRGEQLEILWNQVTQLQHQLAELSGGTASSDSVREFSAASRGPSPVWLVAPSRVK